MKRKMSRLATIVAVVVLCALSTLSAYAADSDMNLSELATQDDGWSSGSFYWQYTTGLKNFSGGTIYVAINSSNTSYNGKYTVQLLKGSEVKATYSSVPANGLVTVNFPNMSSGMYRLKFISGDDTSLQKYQIVTYGTI